MSDIFISYASEDTDFARRLAGAFEGEGWSVWWDKQIPPGMDYAQVIEAAVNEARCVVVLWSRHSIGSRWVHTEAAAGADRDIVATVIVDDTPGESIPFEFRRLQAGNLKDWRPGVAHAGFDLLASRVRSILKEPPKPRPPVPPHNGGGMVSWKEALTSLGSGKQRAYRIGAAISGFVGLGACSEALDYGDSDTALGAMVLLGLAAYLLYLGRKPS
ncbi:MAG: toll/interleukin-1 receptor domain-containing protein [Sedimenticolaceae bacterium]